MVQGGHFLSGLCNYIATQILCISMNVVKEKLKPCEMHNFHPVTCMINLVLLLPLASFQEAGAVDSNSLKILFIV
jgi:hypothetical protein